MAANPWPTLAVLAVANLLNNRLAPKAYLPTCMMTSGVLLALARRDGYSVSELGYGRQHVRSGLTTGAMFAGLVAAGYGVAAALPWTHQLLKDERVKDLTPRQLVYQALVEVPFGTVLLEETAFRGVLPARLGHATSAGLFGLWHILPAQDMAEANPLVPRNRVAVTAGAVLSTAVSGLLFNELRKRSGSILAPMGLHLATNSLGYLAAWLVTRRETPDRETHTERCDERGPAPTESAPG